MWGNSAAARELDISEDAAHSPGSADRDIEQVATVAHEAQGAGRHTRAEARADKDHVPRVSLEPVCGLCDQAPLIDQFGRKRFGDLVGDPVRLLPERRADTNCTLISLIDQETTQRVNDRRRFRRRMASLPRLLDRAADVLPKETRSLARRRIEVIRFRQDR